MRKGELSTAEINRLFPHQLALEQSRSAALFDGILAFEAGHDCASRHSSVFYNDTDFIIYRFANEADAEAFLSKFGGIPFNPADRGRGHAWARWRPGASNKR